MGLLDTVEVRMPNFGLLVKWYRHLVFIQKTRVQFPYRLLKNNLKFIKIFDIIYM